MATKAPAKKKAAPRGPRRVPGSMADQINNLLVGQSVAVGERFENGTKQSSAQTILDACKRVRSGLASYVARVTDELDTREFKIESGTFLSDDKSGINVVATVTRIE